MRLKGRAISLFLLLSTLPGLLDNLLGRVGPWAVMVGQSLTAPLGTGEEKAEEAERT